MSEFDDALARHELYHKMAQARKRDWNKYISVPVDTSGSLSTLEARAMAKELKELIHEKKEKPKMRKYFIELKNRKGKVKIIICGIQQGGKAAYGMAIRSKEDVHDVTDGSRIAFARAVRAMKHRKPCFVCRPEVTEAIWSLKLPDFKKLMHITSGMTSDFAKGDDLWAWDDDLTTFIKEIDDVS